jgi:hypothetical protein
METGSKAVDILHPTDLLQKIDALERAYNRAVAVLDRGSTFQLLMRKLFSLVVELEPSSYVQDGTAALAALDTAIRAFDGLASRSTAWIKVDQRLVLGRRLAELEFLLTRLQRDLYDQQMPFSMKADLQVLRDLLHRLGSLVKRSF